MMTQNGIIEGKMTMALIDTNGRLVTMTYPKGIRPIVNNGTMGFIDYAELA